MEIFRYDAQAPVNSEDWLKFDEYERIDSVTRYHRRQRIRLPDEHLQSMRKARTGSMDAARRAGMNPAIAAATISTPIAMAITGTFTVVMS